MTGEPITEPRPRCHCCGAEIGWDVQYTWDYADGPLFGSLVAWLWEHRPRPTRAKRCLATNYGRRNDGK